MGRASLRSAVHLLRETEDDEEEREGGRKGAQKKKRRRGAINRGRQSGRQMGALRRRWLTIFEKAAIFERGGCFNAV